MGTLADRPLVVNVIHHRHDVWQSSKDGRPRAEEITHGGGLPLVLWKAKAEVACCVTRRSRKAALKFVGGTTSILGMLGG
jgi:hypothetical protein